MEIAERPVINFTINGPSEVVLSEEAIAVRRRKLQEAKKHLALIDEKIQELQIMLRRLSRKPRFHKLQYVLKHRVAVFSGNSHFQFSYEFFRNLTHCPSFSGLRSVYLKYCCNLQEDINQFQSF